MHDAAADRVVKIIETFRSVDHLMGTGSIMVFVAVAREPGLTADDYTKRTGSIRPVIYRLLAELGGSTRRADQEIGRGLVDVIPHPEDKRQNLYRLTPRGEILWRKVLQAASLEEASQEGA
jgi:DNA-binding MarR family transcriptional regulator